MKVIRTYRDFINNPWAVVGFGIAASLGYLLDSIFYTSGENLYMLNFISSGLTGIALAYYLIVRRHEYTVLKIFALIFWGNLLIAPFILLDYTPFEFFFLRNSIFYFSLLPIVALMFGTKEYIVATILFFIQFSTITFLTNNDFLVESFVTIVIVLAVYAVIIYAFIISINHYFDSQTEAQQKLKDQSHALVKSDSTKGKLLSIIGHDLRSPLMSLTSLSVLIEDEIKESKNEELVELIGILNTTIDQTAFLVNNLLEWSRTQENRITIDLKPIRIEPFLNSLRDLHSFSLNSKNIDFSIGPIDAIEIFADQNTLQTILRNIVTNSIKFTPEGGQITISSKSDENGTYVIISDTGIGMDEESIEKLLDIDVYSSRKGTHQEKGSGIGFNLCVELMQLHHGTIEIDSTQNVGTTITLFFPGIELQAAISEQSNLPQ
jgi:signal transduction histidine kinase